MGKTEQQKHGKGRYRLTGAEENVRRVRSEIPRGEIGTMWARGGGGDRGESMFIKQPLEK